MIDVLIRNGRILDGSGCPPLRSDVAVEGDRITAVEPLPEAEASMVVDAAGLAVAPGFIDMHSHADFILPVLPGADSKVRQGVTLEVVGNCGMSPAPLNESSRRHMVRDNYFPDVTLSWNWESFGSFLAELGRIGTAVNVAPLVGHGTVRTAVIGVSDVAPSKGQLSAMADEVKRAMDEGAVGVSSGLIYPPGCYAKTEELIAVARVAGRNGGIYFSHIRGEGETLLEAVEEAMRVGREAEVPVQISHLKAVGRANWPKMARALEIIDEARARGQDVAADMYPYRAGSTRLNALLPSWAHDGGMTALLERLADAGERRRMAVSMRTEGLSKDSRWEEVLIAGCPPRRDYEGRSIAEIAGETDKEPEETVFDILLLSEAEATMVIFVMDEANLRLGFRHPAVMVGSDAEGRTTRGVLAQGKPHPRNFGTFPKLLGHYVREERLVPLEAMVRKMTGLAADRMGFMDRGYIRAGMKADIVVFDPATIRDRATYAEPHQYPDGIPWVFVNGEAVGAEGEQTAARPGGLVRR
jgi:N-acyl-D-amino-acid deacylase